MNKLRILHYSLGFPPYRTGGMTTFCMDILNQELEMGHEVSLLWPGRIRTFTRKTSIQKKESINGIGNFELINPLPVPFDEGITDINAFTNKTNKDIYIKFLRKISPSVIHIHTFMGLHIEFLEAAKILGINTLFTTHDFFPICPRVTLFRDGNTCETAADCSKCAACNQNALSITKIKILQSPIYRHFKDNKFVVAMRKKHRNYILNDGTIKKTNNIIIDKQNLNAASYKNLREYYENMIKLIDCVHYNSELAKSVYDKFFKIESYEVISISHGHIVDKRKEKEFDDLMRITYLGPQGTAKGYYMLIDALDVLLDSNKKFELNIFFKPMESRPYIVQKSRYIYTELDDVFNKTDLLVAPSLWSETFGYTVLEALSFGVPVMISDTVGAKDIIPKECGIIIDSITKEKLADILIKVDKNKLRKMNQNILERVRIKTIKEMADEIISRCYVR